MSFWKKKNQESEQGTASGEVSTQPNNASNSGLSDKASASLSTEPKASIGSNTASAVNQTAENSESSFLGSIQQQDNTYSKVRSALSAGTVIQGKLSFDTPVRIDGKLSGEVYSSKVLIVGETAQINASIEASSLVIMGQVKGAITATEKVQLCSGSSVEGNIKSPALVVESGALFNGKSEMTGAEKSKSDGKETKIYSNENVDLEAMLNKSSKSEELSKSKSDSPSKPSDAAQI